MKKLLYTLSLSALLLTACGEQKEYPTMSEVKAEQVEKKAVEKEKKEAIESAKPPEERIVKFINKELGEKTNNKKDRIVAIDKYENAFEVILNADDSLTTNLTRKSTLIAASGVMKELQSYKDVNTDVIVGFNLDLVDALGNVTSTKVMSIRINQETLQKINFESFNFENLAIVSDIYFLHEVLNK